MQWKHIHTAQSGNVQSRSSVQVVWSSFTEPFKLALLVEIKAWKLLFGHSINNKYKQRMDEITQFVSEYSKRLGRQINDLEDVRNAMAALEDIRQNEIRIDMILGPIEVLLQICCDLHVNSVSDRFSRSGCQ